MAAGTDTTQDNSHLLDETKGMPIRQAVGVSGLRQYSGYVREEFLAELTGARGRKIFQEMAANDATCGAVLFAIKNLLRAQAWNVTSADPNNSRAEDAKELVEGMMEDMVHTWPEFIESVCSMFTYGFSVHEVVWKQRKGRNASKPWLGSSFDDKLWAPQALAARGQRTIEQWIYDGEEHLLGFVQFPPNGTRRNVPLGRCLHFRTTSELGNPEGQSLLRTAYRSWYWLKRLQEIEGIGSERDLAGYPILRVPGDMLDPSATTEQQQAKVGYEEFLRRVRRDQNEGVLLPSDRDENGNLHYEFELLSSGGTRQVPIAASIERYEKAIARSVLADFIFLGSDGGGSLALGQTKVQFFMEAMKSYANHIAAQINETLIPAIWRMNGLDLEIMPTIEPGRIDKVDIEAIGSYIKALSDVGFDLSTDTNLENQLRRDGELPEAPDRTEDDDYFPMPSGRAVPTPVTPEGPETVAVDSKTGPADRSADTEQAGDDATGEDVEKVGADLSAAYAGYRAEPPAAPPVDDILAKALGEVLDGMKGATND